MAKSKTRFLSTSLNVPGRPIAAVVGLDPAYSGPAGLSVLTRAPTGAVQLHGWNEGQVVTDVGVYRWLGDQVSEVCLPGERVVLVSERDSFGSLSVARQLGIAIGVVEGLLLDLNALDPDSRVDVPTSTWRAMLGAHKPSFTADMPKAARRGALKQAAISHVLARFGARLPHNAAEAVCIAEWYDNAHPGWGAHERPKK